MGNKACDIVSSASLSHLFFFLSFFIDEGDGMSLCEVSGMQSGGLEMKLIRTVMHADVEGMGDSEIKK